MATQWLYINNPRSTTGGEYASRINSALKELNMMDRKDITPFQG